jgi:hypothetical protein
VGVGQSRGGQAGTLALPEGYRMFFARTNSRSVSAAFSRQSQGRGAGRRARLSLVVEHALDRDAGKGHECGQRERVPEMTITHEVRGRPPSVSARLTRLQLRW